MQNIQRRKGNRDRRNKGEDTDTVIKKTKRQRRDNIETGIQRQKVQTIIQR
jgi:hypothetical protein